MAPLLNLDPDELLTTTRSVRKRLDLERPVERAVIEECLEVAIQAPTGSNMQGWHWVFVEDPAKKQAFAERHPELVARLALDAMVWTGEGSPTLEQRRKKLPEFQSKNRRPINKAFIHSIFDRDHPGTAEEKVINAFADAVVALDTSVPTGTYVDMCSKLPVVNPEKITVPTLIMRGQWDGIASIEDLLKFYAKLPNPDKQFTVMPGISHASFQQKNYMLVYHILASFFGQPAPMYRG